jgi:hypothetical protein
MNPKVNMLDISFGDFEGGTSGVKLVVEIEGGEWSMTDPIGTALRVTDILAAYVKTIEAGNFEKFEHPAQADGDSGDQLDIYDLIVKRLHG